MKPEIQALFEPEEEFLLCCARTVVADEARGRMESLLACGLDWDRIVRQAGVHGVVPLLNRYMKGMEPGSVPERVTARVEQIARSAAIHTLALNGEFVQLVRQLSEASISVLALKGPTLAQLAYGTVGLRVFADLDLLVQPGDFAPVKDLLIARGYRPVRNLSPNEEEAYLSREKSYEFVRGRSVVEVHWSLMHARHRFNPDMEEVWARAPIVEVGGVSVRTLPTEMLLLYLCTHGASHYWMRLKWICDIAEVLRVKQEDLDWHYLLEQAERLNRTRTLWVGLLIARELLGAPLPVEVEQEASRDRQVRRLVRLAPMWLFRPPAGPRWPVLRAYFDVAVRERARDRIQVLKEFCALAAEPSQKDRAFVNLPEYAQPLYYIVRPFRVIADLAGNRGEPTGRLT